MRREDEQRLQDILDAIGRIRAYRDGAGAELDERTRDGIFYNFLVIGEAANALPSELTEAERETDWQSIVGLRNFLAHKYFDVDLELIEQIISDGLDPLQQAVERLRNL